MGFVQVMSKYILKVKINTFVFRKSIFISNAPNEQMSIFLTGFLGPSGHHMTSCFGFTSCCFRTLWQDAPSSREASSSIWRRIGSGGIGLCPFRTATASACMRAKRWVLLTTWNINWSDVWALVYWNTSFFFCSLSNRHMIRVSTREWPSTLQVIKRWRRWRNTSSWLTPASQVMNPQILLYFIVIFYIFSSGASACFFVFCVFCAPALSMTCSSL